MKKVLFSLFLIFVLLTEAKIVKSNPQWLFNKSSTPSVYNFLKKSVFNVTWNDSAGISIDTVLIELNFTGSFKNYTMFLIDPFINSTERKGVYSFNISLPAGTFCWRSYANASNGEWNKTDRWCFNIEKSTPKLPFKSCKLEGWEKEACDSDFDSFSEISSSQATSYENYTAPSDTKPIKYEGKFWISRSTAFVTALHKINIYAYNFSENKWTLIANVEESPSFDIPLTITANLSSDFLLPKGVVMIKINASTTGTLRYYESKVIFATKWLKNFTIIANETNLGDSDIIYCLYNETSLEKCGSFIKITRQYSSGDYYFIYNSSEGQNYTTFLNVIYLSIQRAWNQTDGIIAGEYYYYDLNKLGIPIAKDKGKLKQDLEKEMIINSTQNATAWVKVPITIKNNMSSYYGVGSTNFTRVKVYFDDAPPGWICDFCNWTVDFLGANGENITEAKLHKENVVFGWQSKGVTVESKVAYVNTHYLKKNITGYAELYVNNTEDVDFFVTFYPNLSIYNPWFCSNKKIKIFVKALSSNKTRINLTLIPLKELSYTLSKRVVGNLYQYTYLSKIKVFNDAIRNLTIYYKIPISRLESWGISFNKSSSFCSSNKIRIVSMKDYILLIANGSSLKLKDMCLWKLTYYAEVPRTIAIKQRILRKDRKEEVYFFINFVDKSIELKVGNFSVEKLKVGTEGKESFVKISIRRINLTLNQTNLIAYSSFIINHTLERIKNATLEFKVKKDWIRKNNISKIVVLRIEDWKKFLPNLIKEDDFYAYFECYMPNLSTFIIAGERKTKLSKKECKCPEPYYEDGKLIYYICLKGECKRFEIILKGEKDKRPLIAMILTALILLFITNNIRLKKLMQNL